MSRKFNATPAMENARQTVSRASELLFRVHGFISEPGADEDFNRLALALFDFQFEAVPIYRKLCEHRRTTPSSVKHWSEIPALPVSAFKEHLVSSLPENERARVFHSSGTTGQVPSRHFHNSASIALYEASLIPWFEKHFLADGVGRIKFIFLTPPPESAPHSSLVHMFETVRLKFGGADSLYVGESQADGSWNVDFEKLENALSGSEPVALLGAAFSFVHWLDHLAEQKTRLRLPAGSRIMETGGYKGRSRNVSKTELRALMTKHLRVPNEFILTEYGMSELSSQAYDGVIGQTRPAIPAFQFPPWARAQIISPETGRPALSGDPGLLRIFDLANMHSVMALQTEDLAVERAGGFELLGRAENAEARGCSLLAVP